jgi:hypothetical protein
MEEEPKYLRVCKICGTEFLAKRPNRKYCSDKCNWAAQSEKKKARNPIRPSQAKLWKEKRQEHYEIQKGHCWLCGQEMERFDLHHLTPNDHDPESKNLVALCKSCHNQIHHVTVTLDEEGNIAFYGKALDLLKEKGYANNKLQ